RLRCRKPAAPGWKNHVRYKTPRVHLAARRRGGGVAARGAGAAGGKATDHRVPCHGHAFIPQGQWVAAFVQRLRELGWIEGRTVAIEYRWAEGRTERAAEIAAEFVRMKVDVIVTIAGGAARNVVGICAARSPAT